MKRKYKIKEEQLEIIENSLIKAEKEGLFVQADISLNKLASDIGVNKTYLSKYFKHYTPYNNFYHFLNISRIQAAEKILKEEPDIPIEELSKKLGFSSRINCHRIFRKYTGKTPKEYVAFLFQNLN